MRDSQVSAANINEAIKNMNIPNSTKVQSRAKKDELHSGLPRSQYGSDMKLQGIKPKIRSISTKSKTTKAAAPKSRGSGVHVAASAAAAAAAKHHVFTVPITLRAHLAFSTPGASASGSRNVSLPKGPLMRTLLAMVVPSLIRRPQVLPCERTWHLRRPERRRSDQGMFPRRRGR